MKQVMLLKESLLEPEINKMKIEQIIAIGFGILCIILIASTGAFSEIIGSFSEALGIYGFFIGLLIVLAIILGFLGIGSKK